MSKFEKFMMYYVTIVSAVGVSDMVFDSVGQEWLYSYQFEIYFKVSEVEIYE